MLIKNLGPRIEPSMGRYAICSALSGKDKYSANIVLAMLRHAPQIDPNTIDHGMDTLWELDRLRIYDARIGQLYNRVARENLVDTVALVQANKLNLLLQDDLQAAINGQFLLDARMVTVQIQKIKPDFGQQQITLEL